MKSLRPYQTRANDEIIQKIRAGKKKIVFQLATGGGKTVTACDLINRFLTISNKKVLFLVHREVLIKQFRTTLYNQHLIVADAITSNVKYPNPQARVYAAMVETAYNRLKKNEHFFGDVGLVIIDEAHLGNFKKIINHYSNNVIVGLTATPIYTSKRYPMKNDYEDIVCGIDIPELIEQGALVPNRTYSPKKGVNRKKLKIKNGEFDESFMASEFSKSINVNNTVEQYKKYAEGTKAIVFNCNVSHSLLVTEAFLNAGYQAMHIDGSMCDAEKERILNWFKYTPGAILNSVAVLTAGYDEPSIQTVIVNRSILSSLPLWLQSTGRGSRLYTGKEYFTILDLGGNAIYHGDWSSSRDWKDLFFNPPTPSNKKNKAPAPIKLCIACEAIISAMVRTCKYCGAQQPFISNIEIDGKPIELELLSSQINVAKLVAENPPHWNKHAVLHRVKMEIIKKAVEINNTTPDNHVIYALLDSYQDKVQEWCSINGIAYNQFYKEITAKWFFDECKKVWGWEPERLSLAL